MKNQSDIMNLKQIKSITFILFLIGYSFVCLAQVDKNSELFIELKSQDSVFFERSFNQCDLAYLEGKITDDLRFYHDQGGIQNRSQFLEATKNNLCANMTKKPIRKLENGSLSVFPLYENGQLYGAIQKGIHHFYIREPNKNDLWTSKARFTHVWILDNNIWRISEVLSYDHKNTR